MAKITDPPKKAKLLLEYDLLDNILKDTLKRIDLASEVGIEFLQLMHNLNQTNEIIWKIEDDIREHERKQDFGKSFIELARSVYIMNDRRSSIKKQINEILGSTLTEEKSYSAY